MINQPITKSYPHPSLWMILYIPFGALGGFVSVALTFLATQSGLSIMEGSLIIGSQLLISWMKWLGTLGGSHDCFNNS